MEWIQAVKNELSGLKERERILFFELNICDDEEEFFEEIWLEYEETMNKINILERYVKEEKLVENQA